jgi:polar amino acid transport system substrate-binding protein
MRRFFSRIGLVWLVCGLGTLLPAQAISTPGKNLPSDIQQIKDRGELIVAMTKTDQPPFFYINSQGQLDGLDVFLANAVASSLNVKVRFDRSAASFNDTVDALVAGRADIAITKLSRTLGRAQQVIFSQPYVTFHQALLINRLQLAKYSAEEATASFVRAFKGKIGVIANSSYVGYAKTNFPQAEIVEYPTWEQAVTAGLNGDVLAIYRDELETKKIMDQQAGASLKLKLVILRDLPDPIAMAMAHDRQQLQAFVNILLDSLSLNLDAGKILRNYGNR